MCSTKNKPSINQKRHNLPPIDSCLCQDAPFQSSLHHKNGQSLYRKFIMADLLKRTERIFGCIIDKYKFAVKEIEKNEVALIKEKSAIFIFKDREGVNLSYIIRTDKGALAYPLGHFLATRRDWVASDQVDINDRELESYALTLENAAQDILSGDELWIKQFTTQSYPVSSTTSKALGFHE